MLKRNRRKSGKKKFTVRVKAWFLDPFEKKAKWRTILKNWFLFLLAGFFVMAVIQSFARYDFTEADTLSSETGEGCDMFAMLLLLILPPIEEAMFRIIPFHYMGRKAALVGSVAWALLHVFGRNFAIAGFQMVMGIFYYKLVISGKYKEAIIAHEGFNLIPLLTCFL